MCKRIIFHNKLLNSQRYMCRQIPQSISVPYHIRPHLVDIFPYVDPTWTLEAWYVPPIWVPEMASQSVRKSPWLSWTSFFCIVWPDIAHCWRMAVSSSNCWWGKLVVVGGCYMVIKILCGFLLLNADLL